MPLYVYRADVPGSACEAGCRDGFEVRQNLSDKALEVCPACHAPIRRVIQAVATQMRHSMKGTMNDYRDDLARFAGDPEAYVDGPRSLQKLIDKRQRQGWQISRKFDAPAEPKLRPAEDVAREAFERAKAKGFKLDGE